MLNKSIITFIVLATALFSVFASDTISADNIKIEYTGRIDFSNPLAPEFAYSGISVRACFSGTSIAAILKDESGNNYYNILLDGNIIDTLNVSTNQTTYSFAEGLQDTIHEIEIFKRTEESFGKTQFFGFVVDDDDTLSAITNQREYLIEYIGNSITCGYGNEGMLGQTFGPTTEDHYMTYAAINSRNFNARHSAVCKSGIGVYRNYDGPIGGSIDCMHNRYTRIFFNEENPQYSFTVKPDVVCINLGTNDFSTTGADSSLYTQNYLSLIDTIQLKYGNTDVICLLGPMLSGTSLDKARSYLQFIADSAKKKGKGDVVFFEMSMQSSPYGIDYHPTVNQHKKNASELTEFIREWKKWKINPKLLTTEIVTAKKIQLVFNVEVVDTSYLYSGFTVKSNNVLMTIDSINTDTENEKLLNIFLHENLDIGGKVLLSYTPGKLMSVDSVSIESIRNIEVENNLIETEITTASTNTKGDIIIFIFNKDIQNISSLENIDITCKHRDIRIDTFMVNTNQLSIYLTDTIYRGDSLFAGIGENKVKGIDEIALPAVSNMVIKNASRQTTAITENTINEFIIFPNPNSGNIFSYQLGESSLNDKIFLEVVNTSGQLVYSQPITENKGRIQLKEAVTPGIYYFKLNMNGKQITHPVTIN